MAEFLIRLRATSDGIVDLADNTWTTNGNVQVSTDTLDPFGGSYAFYTGSSGNNYLYQSATNDSRWVFTPSDMWTFSAWILPINGGSYCALINGGRAIGYQRISYKYSGYPSRQPAYIPNSGTVSDATISISDDDMCDGNWHHVAVTQDGLGYIRTFYDGTLLREYNETQNVDWGYSRGTGILGELRGDNNAFCYGHFQDICLIRDEVLWTRDFTPPTNYLELISYAYLSNNSLYTGASLTNLTNNWNGITNAEKEALVPSFSSEIPSIQDLASISPFRVLTDDISLANVKVTGQPKVQTIEPTSLINTGAVSTVQSINITNTITDVTVKFAITTDLTTYKVYDATQGAWVTSTDVEQDGMSIAQINALTPQILSLLDVSNGVAFKQCFIGTSENASAELSEISAVVDIDGSWTQSVHDTDYEVAYPNKTTMTVKLKTNGDFIINYPVSEGSIPAPSRFDSNTLFAVSFANGEIEDEIGSTIPTDTTTQLPSLDTTTYKYGTSSAYFDGTKGVGIPYDSKFDFGTGDFTIDFWYRQPQSGNIYSNDAANILGQNNTGVMIVFFYQGSLYIGKGNEGFQTQFSTSIRRTDNEFHHFAIVRSEGTVYLFIDGNLEESGANNTSYQFISSGYIGMGNQDLSSSHNGLIGWINGYRISKTARWTSNFTPPTDFYSW